MISEEAPEEQAARKYMAHKGYPDLDFKRIEEVDDELCWYFIYELPEGEMELEVEFVDGEWRFTAFMLEG